MENGLQKQIDDIIIKYENVKGSLIQILQEIQDIAGYLPKETLQYLSKKIKIPLSKIYGVVTFYSQFHLTPRGKYIIKICRGTACHLRGGKTLIETVGRLLKISDGQTTSDLKFTLETVACLGACALAPLVVINGIYYGKMTSTRIQKLIDDLKNK